jgi:hypothetical protein
MKMKKLRMFLTLMFIIGLCAGVANAQVSQLNVPGSLLVFPLIDNINGITYVDLVNRADVDVWLQGFIIAHEGEDDDDYGAYHKKDFNIKLTHNQPLLWNTAAPLRHEDGFVQGFNNLKGYMVIWAIDGPGTQMEIAHDELKGDAIFVVPGTSAFRYNAIPHQSIAITPDRVLNLDGLEYTQVSEKILCEGIAGGVNNIGGTLVVANMSVDFIESKQPEFDINLGVYNEDENFSSRHVDFEQFEQYDLDDLQLNAWEIDSVKFQFATTAAGNPLWAVFFQYAGNLMFGGQCFMDPAGAASASIVLAPVAAQ